MKKVVADTSALISIALSGKLDKFAEAIDLVVPKAVKLELTEIHVFAYPRSDIRGDFNQSKAPLVGHAKRI